MEHGLTLTFGTDGSCLRNPDGPTGWAYICDNGNYAYGGRASGTNQIGELMAILTVLRDHPHQPLEIQSDSAYAIGCSSTWKPGWQRAGYVRKTGPIANLDIIREIHQLLDGRGAPVRFVKVKAHLRDESVHPLNVRADELAGRGARGAQAARGDVLEAGHWPLAGSPTAHPPTPTTVLRPPVEPGPPSRAVLRPGAEPARPEAQFLF
ncbi:ribonuclease H family protein [Nakamurella panacisegetis]|nr:ribonuclease H [Nakamurella panacisegetis]